MISAPTEIGPLNVCHCIVLGLLYGEHSLTMNLKNDLSQYLIREIGTYTTSTPKSFTDICKDMMSMGMLELFKESIDSISSLDDIFVLFNNKLKGIRSPEQSTDGSVFDIYLRKNLLSFSKLDFTGLTKFYSEFVDYVKGSTSQKFYPSKSNSYIDSKLGTIEMDALKKPYKVISNEIDCLSKDSTSKYLLMAINNTSHSFDINATEDIHMFYTKYVKSPAMNRQQNAYYALLALAKMHLHSGNIDEAMANITEAVKIMQSKNDKEGIMECLICMHHMLGLLGYMREEKMIIEHMLEECSKANNNYMFALAACNYAQLEYLHKPTTSDDKSDQGFLSMFGGNGSHIWKEILLQASKKLSNLLGENDQQLSSQFYQLKPLIMICEALVSYHQTNQHIIENAISTTFTQYYSSIRHPHITNIILEWVLILSTYDLLGSFDICEKLLDMSKPDSLTSEHMLTIICCCYQSALNRYEFKSCNYYEDLLMKYWEQKSDPSILLIIWNYKCMRLEKQESFNEAIKNYHKLIKHSEKHGFIMRSLEYSISLARAYKKVHRTTDALVLLIKCRSYCIKYNLPFLRVSSSIYLANYLIYVGYSLESLSILEDISPLINLLSSVKTKAFYYHTKAIAILSFLKSVDKDLKKIFIDSTLCLLNNALKLYISVGDLEPLREVYYLQAQIYNDLGEFGRRDEASMYFVTCDEQIASNTLRVPVWVENFDVIAFIKKEKGSCLLNALKPINITIDAK